MSTMTASEIVDRLASQVNLHAIRRGKRLGSDAKTAYYFLDDRLYRIWHSGRFENLGDYRTFCGRRRSQGKPLPW